jgi:hypothetical protein
VIKLSVRLECRKCGWEVRWRNTTGWGVTVIFICGDEL